MAELGKIKGKGNSWKIVVLFIVFIAFSALAYVYMFNHYTTEELAKFALIRFLFQ